ncbi:hypothetical protein D8T59_21945, partial [Vibrio vulnificus]
MSDRQDLSSSLVHLTRGATVDGNELSPVDVLLKILRERTIVGSTTAAFFKVVVIIRLVIKRLFFLDLDEPHQRVHSSLSCLTNALGV